jgi:outer membrane biosynthesis protein TonB
MSQNTADDTALLQTIAELRADVNRLIDEQLTRVRTLEEKRVVEAGAERRFTAPPPPPTPAPPAPLPPPVVRAPRPQPAVKPREQPAELPTKPETDDPSQRLDALARHLDGRLRRASGKAKPAPNEPAEQPVRRSGDSNGTASEARQ